jgi:hypothetical protein
MTVDDTQRRGRGIAGTIFLVYHVKQAVLGLVHTRFIPDDVVTVGQIILSPACQDDVTGCLALALSRGEAR